MLRGNRRVPLALPHNLLSLMPVSRGAGYATHHYNQFVRSGSTLMPASVFYNDYADMCTVYSATLAGDMNPDLASSLVIKRGKDTIFNDYTRWRNVFTQYCRDLYGPIHHKRVIASHFVGFNFAGDCVQLTQWLPTPVTLRAHTHITAGSVVLHRNLAPQFGNWPRNCVMIDPDLGDVMLYCQTMFCPPSAIVFSYLKLYMLPDFLTHLGKFSDNVSITIMLAEEPHFVVSPFGDLPIPNLMGARLHLERADLQALLMYARHCLVFGEVGGVVWDFHLVDNCTIVEPLVGGFNLLFVNQKLITVNGDKSDKVLLPCFAQYATPFVPDCLYQLGPDDKLCLIEVPHYPRIAPNPFGRSIPISFSFVDICVHAKYINEDCQLCKITGKRKVTYWQASCSPIDKSKLVKVLNKHIAAWYALCVDKAINNAKHSF